MDTLPRTGASQEPIGYHRGMKTLGDHLGSIRCSSCLRLQLFGVETFLLLPKCQSNGGALEDLFHLMVVISIQTTELLRFLRELQLSTYKTVLRTVVRLNAQPTVGPELPLAAEPVRGLH